MGERGIERWGAPEISSPSFAPLSTTFWVPGPGKEVLLPVWQSSLICFTPLGRIGVDERTREGIKLSMPAQRLGIPLVSPNPRLRAQHPSHPSPPRPQPGTLHCCSGAGLRSCRVPLVCLPSCWAGQPVPGLYWSHPTPRPHFP